MQTMEQLRAARQRANAGLEERRALAGPADFGWSHPILTDPMIASAERGDKDTLFWMPIVMLLKQCSLRMGRNALMKVHETGYLDPKNGFQATNYGRNTCQGLIQLANHAFIMALFEQTAQRGATREVPPGIFEIAAQFFRDWCREPLSMAEMMMGMSLQATLEPYVPYSHLQAWERVHTAMRATPGLMLSKPARVSLTRLVFDWGRASRPLSREHEVELLHQIMLYASIEKEFGHDDKSACELFETTSFYHQRRVLEAKRISEPAEQEFYELAPILGSFGGFLPKASMLDSVQVQAVHMTYGARAGFESRFDLPGGDSLEFLEPNMEE
jgi:hypothetical protein